MNSLLLLLWLLLAVVLLFILPIKKRAMNFDEKGEAIKVYQEEVAHLERQQKKGFIDADEKTQLLTELDQKSALAIMAIDKKNYGYRRSFVPLIVVIATLSVVSFLYYRHYQRSGVMNWRVFTEHFQDTITEGLFDDRVVDNFVADHDAKTSAAYCFAMQQRLLKDYDTNPDTLANLAQCHLSVGSLSLASDAIQRGLTIKPKHHALNYLAAELDFVQTQTLSPVSLDRLMQVIQSDTKHFKTLRLLAVNSLNQGDYRQAKFFFGELRKVAGDNPGLIAALDRVDAQIAEKLAKQSSVKNPSASANASMSSAVAVKFDVMVKVSPAQATTLSGQQTLFIIVKSIEGQLLTASKHILDDAKNSLTLTVADNQPGAMQVQPIAGHQQLTVTARISRTGSPVASSGDLTSKALPVTLPIDKPLVLTIDQVVP